MTAGHTITVRLKRDPMVKYDIEVRPGLFERLPEIMARRWAGREIFVITDSTVARLYGRKLLQGLHAAGLRVWLLDFPPGEASKQADVAYRLHTALLSHGIKRDSLLVALGGGVVGDLAGYVAATVLRGVQFIQVPSTLLGQVDSSVGGKVGIDHPLGKNLIGAFHQPEAVYIDPLLLRTLRREEFRNGVAEIVKIAVALDRKFFGLLERRAAAINRRDPSTLTRIIKDAVGLKAAVVQKDEFEAGLRKTLNAGHTIGHAIEATGGFSVKHGLAVAMGLVAEARIAVDMGLLKAGDFRKLLKLQKSLGLPTSFPREGGERKFRDALALDKKSDTRGIRFVLLNGIGSSVVGVRVPEERLAAVVGGAP